MTTNGRTTTDDEIAKIANDFTSREFSGDELATIEPDPGPGPLTDAGNWSGVKASQHAS